MFTIKFTLRIGQRSVSVAFKTRSYDKAVALATSKEGARVYKGAIPTNLHTIRG